MIPAFVFRGPSASHQEIMKFLVYVSQVFFHYIRRFYLTSIPEFTLDVPYRQQVPNSFVSLLIHQALNLHVNKLKLILTNGNHVNGEYFPNSDSHLFELPGFLNNQDCLTEMDLAMCTFDQIREGFKWNNLINLRLSHTFLDRRINKIVMGCPNLDTLELFECWGFDKLNFEFHNCLNNLLINGVWPSEINRVTISAPSIENLVIKGKLYVKFVLCENIACCLDVKLDFYWTTEQNTIYLDCDPYNSLMLQRMLHDLRKIRSLSFGSWLVQIISSTLSLRFEFPLCKNLTLTVPVLETPYHIGLLRILNSCTKLQSFNIIDRRSHPFCKICPFPTLCIHEASMTYINYDPHQCLSFPFVKMTFYGGSVNAGLRYNNLFELPEFVRFIIESSKCTQNTVHLRFEEI